MTTELLRERIKNQLDNLPEECLKETYDYILFIEQKYQKEKKQFHQFGLDLKAFDFWLNDDETNYTSEDIKDYDKI